MRPEIVRIFTHTYSPALNNTLHPDKVLYLAAFITHKLTDSLIISQTEAWIRSVVVGCNFCPFAAKALLQKSIRYRIVHPAEAAKLPAILEEELKHLDEAPATETTFIIFSGDFTDFDDYLDLVAGGEDLLEALGYGGIYQLASFHPLYRFAGAPEDDPANYTNRSVYPMLHLLREDSVTKALAHYQDPEGIPGRNIDFARHKGLAYMEMLRAACL